MSSQDIFDEMASSEEKQALLRLLLAEEGFAVAEEQPITPREQKDNLALSFAQQRMWLLDQLKSQGASYNFFEAFRLQGALNISALQQSLQEIVLRHEVLRTIFVLKEGQPVQEVIALAWHLVLPMIDLRGLSLQERELELYNLVEEEETVHSFDLSTGPLFRAFLLRSNEQEHILFLTMHHIASDGWSLGILHRELAALYTEFSRGRPSPLPDLALQYADFALWQRQWLQGEVLEQQLDYWQRQLAGMPALLELPTDHPRPATKSYRGAVEPFSLPASLSKRLKILSQQEHVTLFMTLLAAFQTLLLRYTGQQDIVIGSPIANRNRAELEGLIGFFVNTLVLRTDLSGDLSFRALLQRVQEVALAAYAHQDLPFEKLVEELHPERNPGYHPLFQVMFALQNAPTTNLELPNLSLDVLETPLKTATFDLSLSLEETQQGLQGWFLYDTDLFELTTITRMKGHFQTLLEGIVANPDAQLSTLPLLTPAEQHLMIDVWNATQAEYPRDQCLHQLFEEHAERTPDKVAVVANDDHLTYAQLNLRANQLAYHLQQLGVGPEITVGLAVESSPDAIIGILSIAKAGGIYVPLDVSYPQDRLAFIMQDTQIAAIITHKHSHELFSPYERHLLYLDEETNFLHNPAPMSNPCNNVHAENLLYVLYTSGSTGKPKGVACTHRALSNRLWWDRQAHHLISEDRVLHVATLNFDMSLWEIWGPLLAGAAIILSPPERRQNPAYLAELMIIQKITASNIVPSLLHMILDEPTVVHYTDLRCMFYGGEASSVDLLTRFFSRSNAQLQNLYGPTEAAISVTAWICKPEQELHTVPIGMPIVNTQTLLLDKHLQPVPIGITGEIYIGGVCLARGYLNRPDLTAERFIPHPFSAEEGARLYKTGDLARYHPNGAIEYIGRTDEQVKLRGARIELGEIATALRLHPALREAFVLVRDDAQIGKHLVAYIVPRQEELPTTDALRDFLAQTLPRYMLPTAFVPLKQIPLTVNGKIDRKALPEITGLALMDNLVAPRTPLEEIVAGIWCDLLGAKQIGVHANFFALGGHSLLATQVTSRISRALRVELPLRDLFDAPTVAALARKIEELTAHEQRAQPPSIIPFPRDGHLPLSFAQERLWFLHQLQPENSLYSIAAALRLQGPLNVAALERSLQDIVRRQEILRTTFPVVEEQAVQTILPTTTFLLPVVDVQHALRREALAYRLIEEEAQHPFDLLQGPLLRTCLLRLNVQEHILLLTMHHIISDAWSSGVFYRELSTLYATFSAGNPSSLPELAIQYADYTLWQRQWLHGKVLEQQLTYWRQQLADLPARLELPTDHPRPAFETFQGAAQTFTLSPSLSAQLRALSLREGVTLFMTLLAAFETLLLRYTGQTDVVVGSPIANRTHTEIEGLIGFFVNTLVLRTNLTGNPGFRGLLERVRETALGAYAHQDLPFEKLVEHLQPERTLSHHPVFQVMFALQNAPATRLELQNLACQWLDIQNRTATFDLTLSLEETELGISGWFLYKSDLFEATTIKRMIGHFQTLLAGIVAHPEQRLSDLPLLTKVEEKQILKDWNETQTTYPRAQCVHQLFKEQAERTPDAVAVTYGPEHLTYRALNQHANQLAHHLQTLGVGPEMLVGIYLERSQEMILAMLSILKAGGAYVPLDLTYPRERLTFMLQDADVSVLLTHQSLLEKLPAHAAHVVCLDRDGAVIAHQPTTTPQSAVTPEHLAYVIYTSGSTGTPKGVAVPQRAINRLVFNTNYVQLEASDHMGQVSNASFDAATFEVWGALLHGARLVGIAKDVLLSPHDFAAQIQEQALSVSFLTTTLFNQLTSDIPWIFHSLRYLLFGGEMADPNRVRVICKQAPPSHLLNAYGPTENTTFTCWYSVQNVAENATTIPIGRPISNTQVYLLDQQLQLVPVGVSGELYIGGDGLARSYLNHPELTAERFIPHPFSDEPGVRLYKTGDLARYRTTGEIEFIGRLDSQVKLRGFRIELGEIEAVLSQHPAVREAVVLLRNDDSNNKRLVAYIVAAHDQGCTSDDLRNHLKQRLPDYMLPSAIMWLTTMPLSSNGKVDRQALPRPDLSGREASESFVAPRTPLEEILAGFWRDVLKVEQISIHDNFFASGGHSLLATQLISRIRTSLRIELPLRCLFEAPTVAELACKVEATGLGEHPSQVPHIQPVARMEHIPLSFAQQRLWFLDQLQPYTPAYNIPLALRLQGELQVRALEQCVQELVERHEILRTTFHTLNGAPIQVIAPAPALPLPFVELETFSHKEILRLINEEALRPFDLTQGPLLRTMLLHLDKDVHVLLLTLHHIVFDGWSSSILYAELAQLYGAFVENKPSPLSELPLQYADFALWQRQWLQGALLEAQVHYWKQQLAELPVLQLPMDHPRPTIETFRGAAHTFVIPPPLSKELKTMSQQEGVTLFMLLLAAFKVLLSRYARQEDIVIGTLIANRNHAEIEGLIGFFVNTLVLRTDLSGNPSFRTLLGRVREVALGAYAHQDLPFEKLVEELHPGRDLSRHPLFQVMFILQHTPESVLVLGDLTLQPLESESVAAKFDLTLALADTAQGLSGMFVYNPDLFDDSTISRMAAHFLMLLSGIAAQPAQPIANLPLLTQAERDQLLVEWHASPSPSSTEDCCIHTLFEAQVARTPNSVAVTFEEETLTFAALNQRANQIAQYLQTSGVGPDMVVGIYMERSLEMVVGLLGILKAGGAYVPLDPAYPQERSAFIVQQTHMRVLLTQQRLLESLPQCSAKVICLDVDWPTLAQQSSSPVDSRATGANLAYVLYTSGSTGRPKGVAIEHRSTVALLYWARDTFSQEDYAGLLAGTSLCFDLSVFELFVPLAWGGCIILAKDHLHLPQKFKKEVTLINTVPSVLTELLRMNAVADSIRTVNIAGEPLPLSLVQQIYQQTAVQRIFNLYGPTEGTTYSTYAAIKKDRHEPPSIGRPLTNTQAFVLDRHLQPIPIGITGDLYLGGACLARGYFNAPELTAERFIPHPFSNETGRRLYRTGDLAYYQSDGNIRFIGRNDYQVKLRGFRIELGEIEAVLMQHTAVREVVVLVREDISGEKRLVAYVVAKQTQAALVSDLRTYLKQHLPDYMIPATFVLLEAMPLTAHGKVNRHALPTPPAFHEESGATPMKPHTTLEQTIAAIWQEVLHINEISIYDNFFDLGGHSLLVVLMGSKLQETLEIDISILDLFDHPTINSLATYLQEGARNSHAPRQERKNTLKKHRADKQKRRTVQK